MTYTYVILLLPFHWPTLPLTLFRLVFKLHEGR